MSILSETATTEIQAILLTALELAQADIEIPDDTMPHHTMTGEREEPCECYDKSASATLNSLAEDLGALLNRPHGDDSACEHPVRSAFNAIIFDVCKLGWRIANPPAATTNAIESR